MRVAEVPGMTRMTAQDLAAVGGGFETFGCARDVTLGALGYNYAVSKAFGSGAKWERVLNGIVGGTTASRMSSACKVNP